MESADHRGRVVLMGISTPQPVTARIGLIQERDLTVRSSVGAPVTIWAPALAYVADSDLDLLAIVSAVYPLSRGVRALAAAQDTARHVKVVLAPDDSVFFGSELAAALASSPD